MMTLDQAAKTITDTLEVEHKQAAITGKDDVAMHQARRSTIKEQFQAIETHLQKLREQVRALPALPPMAWAQSVRAMPNLVFLEVDTTRCMSEHAEIIRVVVVDGPYAKTEKEAYGLLEEAKYQQKQGTLATGPQQTVQQFLEYWLENVQKPARRLNTYVGNKVIINKHLIPGIGQIKLHRLAAAQLQRFYANKMKEGTSASRIRAIQKVLHKALAHAKRLKLVAGNISEDVDLPPVKDPETNVLTPEQAQHFIQKIKEHHPEVLLMLAITTAIRKGEMLSLRWTDIDCEKGMLWIRRTVYYISGMGFVEGEPKTLRSEREILLSHFVLEALKQHQRDQEEKRSIAGSNWVKPDLAFCGLKGNFIYATTLRKQLNKLLKDIGLPHIRFHDLRHSSATLLVIMGVPERVVQDILGHTSSRQTMRYLHIQPQMKRKAMNQMDDFFKP